jgi:hypothetical protein
VTFIAARTGTPAGVTALINTAQYGSAQTALTNTNSTAHTLAFTAVDLNALEALPSPSGGVLVKWQVSNLRNALGFHVMRGDSADVTSAKRVTERMIAAQGESYSWTDAAGSADAYYWLEEHELSGKITVYGPTRGVKPAAAAPVQALTAFVALTPAQIEQTQVQQALVSDAVQTQARAETGAVAAASPAVADSAQAAVEAPVVSAPEPVIAAPVAEAEAVAPVDPVIPAAEQAGAVAPSDVNAAPVVVPAAGDVQRAEVNAAVAQPEGRGTAVRAEQPAGINPLALFSAAAALLLTMLGAAFGGLLIVLRRRG